jgi:hypothetical protein
MKGVRNMAIFHSGGAIGSDQYWSELLEERGYSTIHHSFQGHNINCSYAKLHTQENLDKVEKLYQTAVKELGRRTAKPGYIKNLLLRNGYQVKDSEIIIAVTHVIDPQKWICDGGTGYAVMYARLMSKKVIVLDPYTHQWYYGLVDSPLKVTTSTNVNLDFLLSKGFTSFAVVGTRKLDTVTKNMMDEFIKSKH